MGEKIDYCVGGIQEVPSTNELKQKATLQGDTLTGAEYTSASVPESRAGQFFNLRALILAHNRGNATLRLMTYNIGNNQWEAAGLEVTFNNGATFPRLCENTTSGPITFSAGAKFCWEIEFAGGGSTIVSYISVQVEFT